MKFRMLVFCLPIIFLLPSCGNSTKKLARGSYESAIRKSVRALQKNPNDIEELNVLKTAFTQSETESKANIDQLVFQNNGTALVEAIRQYEQLQRNNDLVRSLDISISSQFALKDYNMQINNLTSDATEALIAEADILMASGNKENQRSAVEKLVSLRTVNPQYPEINRLIEDAEAVAIYLVFIDIEDKTSYDFEDTLELYLEKEKWNDLNSDKWLQYSLHDSKDFDGEVKVVIHKIGLEKSIQDAKSTTYQKEKQMPEYVLDDKGNVKKDADGNDVKIMKTETIKATVIEERIDYDLVMRGNISYLDHYGGKSNDSEELSKKLTITQSNYQIQGDRAAIDQDMLEKIELSNSQPELDEKNLVSSQMKFWKEYIYDQIADSKRKFD